MCSLIFNPFVFSCFSNSSQSFFEFRFPIRALCIPTVVSGKGGGKKENSWVRIKQAGKKNTDKKVQKAELKMGRLTIRNALLSALCMAISLRVGGYGEYGESTYAVLLPPG